jgi:hypothetical protein
MLHWPKACFSTQLTDGLRWTLDHCFIDDGLRQLLIRRLAGARAGLAGFDNTIVGTLLAATRLRRHHLLHSAGSSTAAGSGRFGRLNGCCARGGVLAGSSDTIFCALLASVLQTASAVCWLLRAGGLLASMTPCSAICGPPSGSWLRPVAGLLRAGGSPASTAPCSALCWQQSGSHLLHSAGRSLATSSGRLQG